MYCAEAQSDVMRSALLTREAHITDEVNITPEGCITFRVSGTHRCKKHLLAQVLFAGWGSRIRTYECQSQSLVPYRLAIPQYSIAFLHQHSNYTIILFCCQEVYSFFIGFLDSFLPFFIF